MTFEKRYIPKKSQNLSRWYNQVVLQTELADYGPAKGTMIFRPYGYAIWELIQKHMNRLIKAEGIDNAYFPLFIPESLLKKEKEHVKGFSPELAVVTIGGGEELKEKLVVRPTSETIMYQAYAKWIQSWRDLPVLINQWNNSVRWEKRTYLFLRTSEFLWQEGHTAHASHKESLKMVKWAMDMYTKIYQDYFALPGFVGKKSKSETFPGANTSLTYESLMPSGKALQSSTSHDLGQNFSKVFNITFQNRKGKIRHVWQTSWGLSTRSIGGLVMIHGDDQGLKLPPKLAPIQIIILPVRIEAEILSWCRELSKRLNGNGFRVKVDARDDETLGYRINKWELKGVPLRVEIGKNELKSRSITVVRRDTGKKLEISISGLEKQLDNLLTDVQLTLYKKAKKFLDDNTHETDSYYEFKKVMKENRGFLKAFWCGKDKCEQRIKDETKATTRCLPSDSKKELGKCVYCGGEAYHRWIFAQAY